MPPTSGTPTGGELSDDGPLYVHLHKDQYGAGSLSKVPCTIVVPPKSPLESLQLTFRVTCHSATRFALPVTFNAYSKVFTGRTGRTLRPIPYFPVPTDPRIVIDVTSSGSGANSSWFTFQRCGGSWFDENPRVLAYTNSGSGQP